ncbi:MAG: hypothetical protein IJL83_02260 [Clostridia bacterium]|nr:hypothetical protein [Clostridia bacterium]
MSVIIPAKVSGSYISADNHVAGAQSSFNDVIIRAVLEGDWAVGEGEIKSLIATFTDARGETASTVLLLPSMLDGEDNAYLIPIPVGAKKYEGDLSLVLTEYEQEPGTDGTASFTGDGSGKQFVIDTMPVVLTGVTVGGAELAPTQWAYEYTTGTLTFAVAPASGAVIEVGYKQTVTARIRRTVNCFLRVLPADYSVVTDDELDSTVVEQLLAELYITRNARNEAVAARDDAEAAKDVAVNAKEDAVAAKNDAIEAKDTAVAAKLAAQSAETNARQSSTQALNYKEAALSAKTAAETAQAAAEAAKDMAVSAKNTAVSAKSDAQISATQALNYATQAFNSKEAALTAKSRAEAAQTASESAKDAAVAAKNDAVSAKDAAVAAKNDAVSAKDAAVSAKTAAETAQAAAEAAAIDASEKAEVILPIDYIQDEMPTNYDENEYWFAPSEGKLYFSTYTDGSGYAWNDVTDAKLKMGNIYVTGNGQIYWCPYDDLWEAKAVPVTHTHTVSQITDFTSGITRKADKVSGAVSGHLAGLNSNGNLTDSGKAIADFAAASHTHTVSQITDFPTVPGLPAPTAADAGKSLMVNAQGEYFLSSGVNHTVNIDIDENYSPSAIYIEEPDGTKHHGADSSEVVTVLDGETLKCYVSYSADNNTVKLNGDIVAGGYPSEGPAEYLLKVTANARITATGSPGSYGLISITMQ